jgi:hypothetical protein
MVAVASRFTLLTTLCTVAVLSFNPLLVGAAVIDTRHPTVFERDRHGVKQQVIVGAISPHIITNRTYGVIEKRRTFTSGSINTRF